MEEKGYIHIYFGDGKGKTTAAVGLAVRAAGNGYRVLFVQFLKDNRSCERRTLEMIPGITCMNGREKEKFVFQMSEAEKKETSWYCAGVLDHVRVEMEQYDVVILDEIICAVQTGMLKEEYVMKLIQGKPAHTELVLTGQSPSIELLEAADYVTEMKKIRHPYEKGVCARKGIEL